MTKVVSVKLTAVDKNDPIFLYDPFSYSTFIISLYSMPFCLISELFTRGI